MSGPSRSCPITSRRMSRLAAARRSRPTQSSKAQERAYRRAILSWSTTVERSFPWRDTSEPYAVLVGEVLLQRTKAESVAPVYDEVIRRWPTPGSLASARLTSIERAIRPLGLAKRAAVLKNLGVELSRLQEVPVDPTSLMRLPGVGPYVAHAVPIFALGRDLPLADWVIARVLRRYFGLAESCPPNADTRLWGLAGNLAAKGRARQLWLGTLDFAAMVCRVRPRCQECPLSATCRFAGQGAIGVGAASYSDPDSGGKEVARRRRGDR